MPRRLLACASLPFLALACSREPGASSEVLARLERIEERLASIEGKLDAGVSAPVASEVATSEPETPAAEPATSPHAGHGHAVAAFAERTHQFGNVWSDAPVEHSFLVRNPGGEPLEIRAVTSSCSCLLVGEYLKRIEPGGEAGIPLRLETAKLKGEVRQRAAVLTNDPSAKDLTLTMAGVVRPVVEYQSFVLLRRRPGDEPLEKRVKITHHRDRPFDVTLTPRPADRFAVSLEETVPDREYDVVIRVDPPFEIGYERATVTLTTNVQEPRSLALRLNLHVPDRIDVLPNQLLLDDGAPGGIARRLTVTNWGDTPVQVLSAGIDDPAATAVLQAREPGKSWVVSVAFPAGVRLPDGGRELVLRTDDAEKPLIRVPIRSLRALGATEERPQRPAFALLGGPAPEFELLTVAGKSLGSAWFAGSPATVLNFFAPNCGFCKKQLPSVEEVRAAYQDRGVRFVNVREVMGGREFTAEETLATLAALEVGLELVIDPANRLGRDYRVTGFPTLFVVDRDGTVREVTIGARPDLVSTLSEKLEDLLAGG